MQNQRLSLTSVGLLLTSLFLIFGSRIVVSHFGLTAVLSFSGWTPETLGVFTASLSVIGYALMTVGAGLFAKVLYSALKCRFQFDPKLVKSQARKIRMAVIALACLVVVTSMFATTPVIQADAVKTTGYYLVTPANEWDYLLGNYTNGNIFAIRGSDWANLMTYPTPAPWASYTANSTAVWQQVLAATTYGTVYAKEVAFPLTLQTSIPVNVQVICNYRGTTYTYINSASSLGSPYTVSVGQGINNGYYLAADSGNRIAWSSTNASYVIQTGINTLQVLGVEGGRYSGKISIKDGTFSLTTGLSISSQFAGVVIEGQGGGTVLAFSGNGACFNLTGETERNILRDFQIILSGDSDNGIQIQQGQKNTIDGIIVKGTSITDARTGILVAGESHWNHIENTLVANIERGIEFAKTGAANYPIFNSISQSQIRDNTHSLRIAGQNIGVSDVAVEQFSNTGIRIMSDSGSGAVFTNVYLESTESGCTAILIESGAGGINWRSGTISVPSGTRFSDSGTGYNTWSGQGFRQAYYVENVQQGTWISHNLYGTPTYTNLVLYGHSDFLPVGETIVYWPMAINSTHIQAGARWLNGTAVAETGHTAFVEIEYQP